MNNKYHVRHCPQTTADFYGDIHVFSFLYKGKREKVTCVAALSVFFDNENLPEEVQNEITSFIWALIDKKEFTWRATPEAHTIADAYWEENFK